MAYSFIKNKKGGVGVLLDSAADISLVPVDQFFPGTFAFTADGSARYRLSTSRSWVEVAGGGDTPGGGWPEDLPLPSEGGYGYSGGTSYEPVTEQSVTLEDMGGDANFGYFNDAFEIIDGETYRVIIGDMEYDGLVAAPVQGVPVITDDPTFANFNFMIVTQMNMSSIASPTIVGEVSVTVERVVATVHKIDSKYLPEVCGGDNTFVATFTAGADGTATCDKTPQEIQQAAFDGKFVCGILYTDHGSAMMLSCIDVEHGEYANSLFSAVNNGTAYIVFTRVEVSDDGTISVYEEFIDIPQNANS